MPAMTPEKASIRKLLRTRSADQLRSVVGTPGKLTADVSHCRPSFGGNARTSAQIEGRPDYWPGSDPPGRGGRTPPGRGGDGLRAGEPPRAPGATRPTGGGAV